MLELQRQPERRLPESAPPILFVRRATARCWRDWSSLPHPTYCLPSRSGHPWRRWRRDAHVHHLPHPRPQINYRGHPLPLSWPKAERGRWACRRLARLAHRMRCARGAGRPMANFSARSSASFRRKERRVCPLAVAKNESQGGAPKLTLLGIGGKWAPLVIFTPFIHTCTPVCGRGTMPTSVGAEPIFPGTAVENCPQPLSNVDRAARRAPCA